MRESKEAREARRVRVYLTSWQKRMVNDFVNKEFLRETVRDGPMAVELKWEPGGCLASYKMPPDGFRVGDWAIYLTDEQMAMVTRELGLVEAVDAVNVSVEDMKAGVIQFR